MNFLILIKNFVYFFSVFSLIQNHLNIYVLKLFGAFYNINIFYKFNLINDIINFGAKKY